MNITAIVETCDRYGRLDNVTYGIPSSAISSERTLT